MTDNLHGDAPDPFPLARYRVIREIGRGSSATVYLARDLEADRDVVAKVFSARQPSPAALERIRREVRRLGRLTHPGLPPLLDAGVVDGRCYLLTPWVRGETLRTRLGREPQLPVADVVAIARQLADTLAYLHHEQVIHRDLKPENIYLAEDGRVLLLDFGLAKLLDGAGEAEVSLTEDGVSVGTPLYMSPEQIAGDQRVDPRSDLYALGCVVYEMLAGEPPFNAPSRQTVARMHLVQPPRPLALFRPAIPASLEAATLRLLAKAPADRFHDAAEFIDALGRGDGPVPRWPGRGPIRQILLLACAAAASGVLLWTARSRTAREDTPPESAPVRIAVLPFDDATPDASARWLALSLARDLGDALMATPQVDVIVPESLEREGQQILTADSIGRLLGARIVISGAVDQSAGRLRTTIRVRDAQSVRAVGAPLRLFSARDSAEQMRAVLVDSVAAVLRLMLGSHFELTSRRPGDVPLASLARLQRGRQLAGAARERFTLGDSAAGDRLVARTALVLDSAARAAPRWLEPAIARGWLADMLAETEIDRRNNVCSPACRGYAAESRRLADSVMGVDARYLPALVLRAASRLRGWDTPQPGVDAAAELDSALTELRSAVSRNPSDARAQLRLSHALRLRGDFAGSAEALEHALAADPWLTEMHRAYSRQFFALLRDGNVAEASRLCLAGRRLLTTVRGISECRLSLLGWYGRGRAAIDSAWRELREVESAQQTVPLNETWSYRRTMVAATLARSGLHDSARAVFEAATRDTRANLRDVEFERAFVLLLAGDTAASVAALRRFIENRPQRRAYVREHPWFAPLRQHAAFRELLSTVN